MDMGLPLWLTKVCFGNCFNWLFVLCPFTLFTENKIVWKRNLITYTIIKIVVGYSSCGKLNLS